MYDVLRLYSLDFFDTSWLINTFIFRHTRIFYIVYYHVRYCIAA